ncbi:MAG: ABC transporter ATP-binding protein [Clostridia bacterium]|nr:ABC transporter ATP-binding protein [Clostridia bacterium]
MNAELVQVAVNGIDVGIIGFAPYEINVGDYLSDGDNKITVKLYSPESSLKIKTTDDGAYVFEPLGLGADRINYEFIEFDNVSKAYKIGENNVTALDKVSFNLENGEFVVIAGPSGSGKTTLLNILGGMDKADSGNVVVEGANIGKLTEKQLTNYRRNDIGFVFQQNNLVDDLTVRENVELASRLSTDAINVNIALQAIGLSDHADGIVANLSAGQQQRVAIARALAKNPKMLLCDEPTGILNKDESDEILSLLYETCKTTNKTAIVVTNNEKIFEKADRVIKLENGCIVESIVNLED